MDLQISQESEFEVSDVVLAVQRYLESCLFCLITIKVPFRSLAVNSVGGLGVTGS